jgi:hypothetical protein
MAHPFAQLGSQGRGDGDGGLARVRGAERRAGGTREVGWARRGHARGVRPGGQRGGSSGRALGAALCPSGAGEPVGAGGGRASGRR